MPVRIYLRKRNKKWTAVFYDVDRYPQQKYVALGTNDKSIAQGLVFKMEREMLHEEFDPWQDALPQDDLFFSEAVEKYLAARMHLRPATIRSDRSMLYTLRDELGPGFLIRHVELRHVERFLSRDLKNETRRTYYARLKGFFGWCVAQGYVRKNLMDRVDKPRQQRTEKPFLTRTQYAHLLAVIEADAEKKGGGKVKHVSLKDGEIRWLKDVVRFAVGTGLRLSELTSLRWHAVDLENRLIRVKNRKHYVTKSGHERTVPVAGESLEVLQRLHAAREPGRDGYVFLGVTRRKGAESRMSDNYVSKRFSEYAEKAGLAPEFCFHCLRHTYISWLVMAGYALPVIQKLAGHQDITTTMGYAHLAPNSLREAVDGVFGHGRRKSSS